MPRGNERTAPWRDRRPVGDAAAASFDAFFVAEHQRLVVMALALTGVREVAVDIAQEAMTRALREWDRVSEMDAPAAWVRRVAVNLVNDWHRANARFVRVAPRLVGSTDVEMADPESERFWQAVRDLPDVQRSAIALHYLEDRSVAEIAEMLDIPAGTVKSSLFRARASLARALGVDAEVRQPGLLDGPADGSDDSEWAP